MHFITVMTEKNLSWLFLVTLALIWGSSFILMKKALISLSSIQVGALRILISGIFLLVIGYKRIPKIQKRHWFYLILNGFIGSFIPVFLYVFAVENIDSAIVSILNSLTPLNTLVVGALFFSLSFQKKQLIGILIGLFGTLILILNSASLHPNQNYWFSGLVIVATICYAFNVNILKRYLQDLDELDIENLPKKMTLFSQTTKSVHKFHALTETLASKGIELDANDTICRQVSNRDSELRNFAGNYDIIIFVSGTKSSNGKVLYNVCLEQNPNSYFVSNVDQLEKSWFTDHKSIGICGATSTPMWLMEDVKQRISTF